MARSMARTPARMVLATLALGALLTQASAMVVLGASAAGTQTAAATTTLADTTAPTQPANFRVVSRSKSLITLGWDASYDAVGVAGYRLVRNGCWMGTLYQAGVDLLGTVMYDRLTGRTRTAITYELYAFDAAGNFSAPATLVITG